MRYPNLLREHFTVKGEAKRPFDSEDEARPVAIKAGKNAYRCYCGKWHIGGKR